MNSKYFDDKPLFLEPQVTQYGGNMVMTNVQKSTKTKYLNVDTRFAHDVNPLTLEYMMMFPERITNIKSIKVRQMELPLSFYNISACLGNNRFQLVDSDGAHEFIIPDGNYTLDQLQDAVNHCIESFGLYFTLGNCFTNVFCTRTTNAILVWWSDVVPCSIKMQLGWALGFRKSSTMIQASNALITTFPTVKRSVGVNMFALVAPTGACISCQNKGKGI